MCNQPHKTNSADIAQIAGVSRSTVSRVINGYTNVPEETRKRVMSAIELHGYYPSVSGKTLRGERAHCIGVFIGADGWQDITQAALLYAFSESAQDHRYMTLSGKVGKFGTPQCSQVARTVLYSGCVDAGVFLNATGGDALVRQLLWEGQTIGALGLTPDIQHDRLFTVGMDAQVVQSVIEYAKTLGHPRLALLCSTSVYPDCDILYVSLIQAARSAGLPAACYRGMEEYELDQQAGAALDTMTGPMMLVCADNPSVYAAYRESARRGLTIGQDISILGMGIFPANIPVWPPLTSFRFDPKAVIDSLSDRLINALEGVPDVPRHGQVPYQWIPGGSCAPIPETVEALCCNLPSA